MDEININPLDLLDRLQNPPTQVPTTLEFKKMSLEFILHAGQSDIIGSYESIDELLEDAEKINAFLKNNK